MPSRLLPRDHVLMARDVSSGTIAGATVGAAAAAILMLLCSLPFILKFRRKRRLRRRQEKDALRPEMGTAGLRPPSQTFSTHANRLSHVSHSRLASAAATLSDHDSQTGKEYGPDGITFHRSAAPSPALIGKTLRSCSPAPSAAMAASSASLAEAAMVASRKNSPAVKQSPFSAPADKELGRSPTFGTMTTEPQPISRSGTGSQHGSQSPTIGTFRKLHNKVFHRGSSRSSGSESRATGSRSPDMDLNELDNSQADPVVPASYLVDDKPVMGGTAEEYYSGAPLSPPQEPGPSVDPQFLNLMTMPAVGAPQTQKAGGPQQLGSPFNPTAPLSPTSPFVKDEELSSEDGGKRSFETAKSDTLSPPPGTRGLPFNEQSPKRFEPPPSPSHPAPGTVNPMDMMKPSTAAEQAAWVDTELWKMENSPPPQLENSPAPQLEPSLVPQSVPSPPSQQQQQPTPTPERPQFQAVVRHPTQMDITAGGQVVPHHEEQVITDISDTSSPGPGFDQYTYGASPSDHTSPETRNTESAYTGTPSPRSSTSNRPASSYGGTGKTQYRRTGHVKTILTDSEEYLGTSPGDHSRPSSQGDGSPKPSSFACDICGSKFDQVHKLK